MEAVTTFSPSRVVLVSSDTLVLAWSRAISATAGRYVEAQRQRSSSKCSRECLSGVVHPKEETSNGQDGDRGRLRDEAKSRLCNPCMGCAWPLCNHLRCETHVCMDVKNVNVYDSYRSMPGITVNAMHYQNLSFTLSLIRCFT